MTVALVVVMIIRRIVARERKETTYFEGEGDNNDINKEAAQMGLFVIFFEKGICGICYF